MNPTPLTFPERSKLAAIATAFVSAANREQLDEHPMDSKLIEATQDAAKTLEAELVRLGVIIPTCDGACTFSVGARISGNRIVWVYNEKGETCIVDLDGRIDMNG